ncbi:hypothetical protein AAHB33_03070 [Paenarthrobacter sp. S56]|uniref:hypothetical protein n=1 Tax=Paenarthrobacter sp. S56 TaxID=3138179 RepID=UPI0032198B15
MSTAATINVQALLHELEASGDWDVQEGLFLTFNVDLAFLERGVLGLCQSMGARVTVIADAGMWHPDPLAMKGAGTEYLVGFASHSGAFHPKLTLLVGEDRVLALIGSGNLTMGGWQHNSELWNVLRAEDGQAPSALFDLAKWLEQLPDRVRLASDHAAALNRVAARLRTTLNRLTPTDDGAQLVTNLDRSFLSQLPGGPVDELTLYAPFIDEHAGAVGALVERFPTPKLTLVVQPGLTVVEPQALASVLKSQGGVTMIADTSGRYRHAKLVEWRRGAHRQVLTGSANLSAAAMLKTVSSGGNVELGILTTVEESLWPEPGLDPNHRLELESITDIPALRIGSIVPEATGRAVPQLLSAVLAGNELEIELSYPVPFIVELEYTNNPLNDSWKPLGTMVAGHQTASFPAAQLGDNALLRLNWAGNDETSQTRGPAVPASVPERLRMRPSFGRAASGPRIKSRDDLLGVDLRYLDAFAGQLTKIHEDVTALKTPSTRRSGASTASGAERNADFEEEQLAWLWELEQTAQHLHGPVFSGFALGLPTPLQSTGWEDFDSSENGDLDADADLYGEDQNAPPIESTEPVEPLAHAADPDRIKKVRRDRIRSFATMPGRLSTVSYLGLARLSLCFYCAGDWKEHDPEPIRHITSFLTKALEQAHASGMTDEAKALAAVTLTCVRLRVDYTATSPATLEAKRLHDRCRDLDLGAVPLSLVTEYTQCLSAPGGRPLETADVYDELQTLSEHPQLDAVIMAAEGHGYDAEVLGPSSLQISVRAKEPLPAATKVLTASTVPLGVIAISKTTGKSAVALWSDPNLYCIEIGDNNRWVHYRSKLPLNVIIAAMQSSDGGRFRVNHGSFSRVIPEAELLAERLGLQIPRKIGTPPGVCPNCYMLLTPSGICATCET